MSRNAASRFRRAPLRPFPRLLAPLAVLAAGPLLAALPREEPAAEAREISTIEGELKAAVGAGEYDKAKALLDELAGLGGVKAYRILIDLTLNGLDPNPGRYDLEQYAGTLLVKSEDPRVRQEVYRLIKKCPNHKTRVILLAAAQAYAGSAPDAPAALEAIHGALSDPVNPVVFRALEAIRKLARPESVDPLIELLEKRERLPQDRLYADLRACLKALTNEDFAASADWKNYWAVYKREGRKPPPRERKGGVTELYKKPQFFSVTVDSDRLYFVIDISESMKEKDPELPPETIVKAPKPRGKTEVVEKPQSPGGGTLPPPPPPPPPGPERERLYRAKQELMQVIDALPESTRFGILAFSHELSFWQGARVLREADRKTKADAKRWVQGLQHYGATRTDLALTEALSIPEVDSIFLLTDGAPRDEQNTRLEIEPILLRAKTMNRFLRCRINTISFENIKDKEMRTFVLQLALQNDGACTFLR